MKRFTETQKWEDPWFRKLKPEAKLLWQWILDHCDNAGVIEPDLELAAFQVGYPYPLDTLSELGERIAKLPNGKWHVRKFVAFQYGTLSEECKPHKQVLQLMAKHGIEGYAKGIHTLKEKDKDQEQEKDSPPSRPKSRGTIEQFREFFASIGLPESDADYTFHKWEGNGWMNGKNPIKDWKATVRQWKAGRFLPSQKTLTPTSSRPIYESAPARLFD
jgi:hypothetical protein